MSRLPPESTENAIRRLSGDHLGAPSQQTLHSPNREPIVTGVCNRRNLVSRRTRVRQFMARQGRTVKASFAVFRAPSGRVSDVTLLALARYRSLSAAILRRLNHRAGRRSVGADLRIGRYPSG